ncbi:hypothetical protein CCL09_15725 [Pseudomonas congelans]|nr:hypothetical protein [Pseudomonas congelans]PBQ04585.1 hypothetical protein CCL07_13625 [Pseudomonas congelans]PBQ16435.1 hypothetical protein CCL09_15725 [Pseudomonas congelans]
MRLPASLLPFAFQRLQRVLHVGAIGSGFLADITLATTEHLQGRAQLRMRITKLVLLGERRHGVDANFTRLGNPGDMVIQRVFARSKQTSQFINSRLCVDIHVDAPSLIDCSIIDTSSSFARTSATQHD